MVAEFDVDVSWIFFWVPRVHVRTSRKRVHGARAVARANILMARANILMARARGKIPERKFRNFSFLEKFGNGSLEFLRKRLGSLGLPFLTEH